MLAASTVQAGDGRLRATGGQLALDGAAGGGLAAFAILGGYASDDQIGFSANQKTIQLDDYALVSSAVAVNVRDRVELSLARSVLDLDGLLEAQDAIGLSTFGLKLRLAGDLIYGDWPIVSAGVQHKSMSSPDVAAALGADRDSDTELYLGASRLFLAGLAGQNLLLSGTVRYTRANQFGLLGFGGPQQRDRELEFEGAAAILARPDLAFGVEYRSRPDALGLGEDDAYDVFVGWFPSKRVSLLLAYVDLGDIAGRPGQQGLYLSLQGDF